VNTFLTQLANKRRKFLEGLDANEGEINLDIFEDFYPDQAHFIFELLQNAEDALAKNVTLTLTKKGCIFEHDGKAMFSEANVISITGIHNSTKSNQPDQIGKFGVGFKSVFVYTLTPIIYSGEFSFKISRLVLPEPIASKPNIGTNTRFELPFNNPKTMSEAFDQVRNGVRGLTETSLLFLSNIKSVSWRIEGGEIGRIIRIHHSENHVEILKQSEGKTTRSSHVLKFDRPVQGLEKQRAAVAFELDFLPNVQNFDSKKPLAEQMKIISANPGRVAVFFPADKEASGLRFHLHAPFVPELSRASIKDTPANLPLFEQLAAVAAASLQQIRDLDLLTVEFLEVLPNGRDPIDERYGGIRSAIIDAMNDQPLTPTQSRTHAPARHLIQGKASLKSLLSDVDLEFLLDYLDKPWRWAVGVPQKNSNADRFMESLSVGKWDIDDFVALLGNKTSSCPSGPPEQISPEEFMEWLRGKSVDRHQALYALLLTDYLMAASSQRGLFATKLQSLKIVRLTDGTYGTGGESFFVSNGSEHDEMLGRVDVGVYTAGKSKVQQENARAFLEKIGVRDVGEAELVEAILKRRYTRWSAETLDQKTYSKDLKRFVDLVEKKPDTAKLFADYFIFDCGDSWRKPGEVFLDQPFFDTGLSAYYGRLGKAGGRYPLSERYLSCGVPKLKLAKFAALTGAAWHLEIHETTCHANPNPHLLASGAPGNWSSHGINVDYHIQRLSELLASRDSALSQLVWNTLCNWRKLYQQDEDLWTTAQFKNNKSCQIRRAPSQLVCVLREREWVPQTGGRFVRPADATRDSLPVGFAFDSGWAWLQEIQFEQQQVKKSAEQIQRQALAKQLGFGDEDTLERAKRFAALPAEEQQRILAAREQRTPVELPEHQPSNPARRAERVAADAADAPERLSEERTRSVSVGLDAVKKEAGQYLCQQYTNRDGQMICQVCKNQLPFKLDDGSDFFERVEFLRGLKRRHQQNYLALCPNHAAKFLHANGSSDELRDLVVEMSGNELAVILAREDETIYFTKTHLADLKAIIGADQSEPETKAQQPLHAIGP